MKPSHLIIIEALLILAGLVLYALGYLPFPMLPLILVAWASLRLRKLRWRDIGLRRPESWLTTIGIALLVGVGYQLLDIFLIAPLLYTLTGEAVDLSQFDIIRGNLAILVASLVVSWTLAAVIEELFFRGYLLNRVMDVAGKERMGIGIALAINAIVFGFAHAYQGLAGVIDTALAGLVLGAIYFFARRNLWLPILTHGIIDTVGFLLIYTGMYY
jgi:uncharacterized protein